LYYNNPLLGFMDFTALKDMGVQMVEEIGLKTIVDKVVEQSTKIVIYEVFCLAHSIQLTQNIKKMINNIWISVL